MSSEAVARRCFFGGIIRFGGRDSSVRGKFFRFSDLCFGDDARHVWHVRGGSTAARLILEELTFHARLDGPVTPFTRIILGSLFLHECFVQTQVMPDAVLPSCFGDAVVGEGV